MPKCERCGHFHCDVGFGFSERIWKCYPRLNCVYLGGKISPNTGKLRETVACNCRQGVYSPTDNVPDEYLVPMIEGGFDEQGVRNL